MYFRKSSISKIYIFEQNPIFYPSGKPMTPHLQRYQRLAVEDYGFALDALDLGHPRLSLN
jgi:hypothetical protein